jgi:hypothetical protein
MLRMACNPRRKPPSLRVNREETLKTTTYLPITIDSRNIQNIWPQRATK